MTPEADTGPRGPEMAVHDYICSVCGEWFSVTDPPDDDPADDARLVCPACGSGLVREHWESRVRNAAKTPPRPIEEMRDCVG